jgi:hypothetical protein
MTPVGTDNKAGADFKWTLRLYCADARHDAVFFNEPRHLGLHDKAKRRIKLRLLFPEVERVPLRHQRQKLAVRRNTPEIPNDHGTAPTWPASSRSSWCGCLRNSSRKPRVRGQCRASTGGIVSPRKSRRKSACFSRTTTATPIRASRKPSIIPAGPPPAMQQIVFSAWGLPWSSFMPSSLCGDDRVVRYSQLQFALLAPYGKPVRSGLTSDAVGISQLQDSVWIWWFSGGRLTQQPKLPPFRQDACSYGNPRGQHEQQPEGY